MVLAMENRMADTPSSGTATDELPSGRYSDRELSWLAFNNRVLDLARDRQRVPLLERAKLKEYHKNEVLARWSESHV